MSIIVQRAVVRMCLALGRQLGWGDISDSFWVAVVVIRKDEITLEATWRNERRC